ncbi:MAG: hypothetical protein WC143_08645 [Eubacteriales bacterium]|jgi:hypothetical protein|nr:hypothetical protein [Clostridia bacterium]
MYFLSIADFIENIVNGLNELWQNIGTWNWEAIKNWVLSGSALTLLGVFAKYVIPILKNSNKPILKTLGEYGEKIVDLSSEIKALRLENKTLKDGTKAVIEYLEVSADVNLSSKVLTAEQKQGFTTALNALKIIDNEFAKETVAKVEEIIEDGVITADEVIELAETNQQVETVFGTKISDLMKK